MLRTSAPLIGALGVNSHMANLSVTLDRQALLLIGDAEEDRILGSGFAFLRRDWVVTAKHVILKHGEPRRGLRICLLDGANIEAKVLYIHPVLDLVVLRAPQFLVETPLYPGHEKMLGAVGLICVGYAPSLAEKNGKINIHANYVIEYQRELRSRNCGDEETILFEAPYAEGGHSGGPIIGAGGCVTGSQSMDSQQMRNIMFARPVSTHY